MSQQKASRAQGRVRVVSTDAGTPVAEPVDQARVDWDRYRPGDVIAEKYRLESKIGAGGMGAVWLARNLTLDANVAIKLVRADKTQARVAERLMVEARAAARLEHPAIVRVYDFGKTQHGDPFIVMEVVRGEELNDLLDRKGNLPAAKAVPLLLPIASALCAAHAQGIIHRDVKPDNIVLMTSDRGLVHPKLVDFGIARVETKGARRLTAEGHAVGTADYMAPEQANARDDIDERVDVWAFSVVLYEMIAGRRPFAGDTHAEVTSAILRDEPRPTTDFEAGDDELWKILERGLRKSVSERWEGMRALGTALANWAVSRGIDVDASGASLEHQWLHEGVVRMLSIRRLVDQAIAVLQREALAADVRPAAVPTDDEMPIEDVSAPDEPVIVPVSDSGWRRWSVPGVVAALVGAGVLIIVLKLPGGDETSPANPPGSATLATTGKPSTTSENEAAKVEAELSEGAASSAAQPPPSVPSPDAPATAETPDTAQKLPPKATTPRPAPPPPPKPPPGGPGLKPLGF